MTSLESMTDTTGDNFTYDSEFKNTCATLLESLFLKCDTKYAESRLITYLKDIIPNNIENEVKTHNENEERKINLEKEFHSFQTFFLSNNKYCYLPNNSTFYIYDGIDYRQVKEDDIIHYLLSCVTYENKALIDWKHKTKISVIKKIKERHIFKHIIPESKTIQKVLNLLSPTFFLTKNEVKYFLTSIGDNILKKPNNLTFYIRGKARNKLRELESMCSIITSINNIAGNFVSKYNENVSYENCRLIKIRNNNETMDQYWIDMLRKDGMNILCVACHYSNAHGDSDNFLRMREELCDYALFLRNNNTQGSIVDNFCKHCFEENTMEVESHNSKVNMSWKNVQYVWKTYIGELNIPNVIYGNSLKALLKLKYKYDESSDSFPEITSKYLPIISDFILFWQKTITSTKSGTNNYEMDELSYLFSMFVKNNEGMCNSNGRILEKEILNIISHYFQDIVIVDKKYVIDVRCSMWEKDNEIVVCLLDAKDHFKQEKEMQEDKTTSFEDIYKYYLQHNIFGISMSKGYFEKRIGSILKQYIEYTNVVSEKWLE